MPLPVSRTAPGLGRQAYEAVEELVGPAPLPPSSWPSSAGARGPRRGGHGGSCRPARAAARVVARTHRSSRPSPARLRGNSSAPYAPPPELTILTRTTAGELGGSAPAAARARGPRLRGHGGARRPRTQHAETETANPHHQYLRALLLRPVLPARRRDASRGQCGGVRDEEHRIDADDGPLHARRHDGERRQAHEPATAPTRKRCVRQSEREIGEGERGANGRTQNCVGSFCNCLSQWHQRVVPRQHRMLAWRVWDL